MKKIVDVLYKYLEKKKPTSQRSALISEISNNLFTKNDFKKILGQTKEFTVEEIREIYDTANSWKTNPPALFWKLVRQKRKEVEDQKETI